MPAELLPRQICFPVIAGTPVADLSWRVALVLGGRLAAAGERVTMCLCHPRFPWGRTAPDMDLLRHLTRAVGIDLVTLPDRFMMEGDVGSEMSARLDDWLRGNPFDVVYLPDHLGLGYFPQLARRFARAHRHTEFLIYLLGPTRPLMWERAMYPSLADVAGFHREAESIAMADGVLIQAESQRASVPDGVPVTFMGDWLEDSERGWPSLLEASDREKASNGTVRIACLTQRPVGDEIELFARGFARTLKKRGEGPRIEVACVQLGSNHAPAQLAAVRKYLAGEPVSLEFARLEFGGVGGDDALALLHDADMVVVPAFGIDTVPLVRLVRALGLPMLAQDHPAVRELVEPAGHADILFNNDWKVLGDLILAALEVPPKPLFKVEAGTIPVASRYQPIATPAPISGDPMVSVVLTLYDRWHHLPVALESLSRQSWPNLEILISDDGSDDEGAVAFLERMDSETRYGRLKVVRQPHHSLGRNRNTAVGQAEGDYVMFMDDDNIAKPHEVETFLEVMRHSGADALSCFCDLFSDEAVVENGGLPASRRLFLGAAMAPSVPSNTLGDANSFFKRDVFERFGKLVERPQLGFEDWEILARIALEGGYVSVVPEALYWYREAPGAMTATTRQLANNLVPLETYLTHAGPFADLLWHVKGEHLRRGFGTPEQIV